MNPHLLKTFLIVLLYWLSCTEGFSQEPAAPGVEEPPSIACPTCSGTGMEPFSCMECAGEGKSFCFACSPVSAWNQRKGALGLSEEEHARKALEIEIMQKAFLRGKELEDGWRLCGYSCFDGKTLATDTFAMETCKLCKGKGVRPCDGCKGKSRITCKECKGEPISRIPCLDCGKDGYFLLDELGEADLSSCPLCQDRPPPDCSFCKGEGGSTKKCNLCVGRRRISCGPCDGKGKRACSPCWGTGKTLFLADGTKPKCKECRGKGISRCDSCKGKKKKSCPRCDGKGKVPQTCHPCEGTGKRTCGGCAEDSYLAWVTMGDALVFDGRAVEAHQAEIALRYFEHAKALCSGYYEGRIARLKRIPSSTRDSGATTRIEGLKDAYATDIGKLEKRVDAVEKALAVAKE